MTTTLQIYRAPSGQWAGKVTQDGEELGRVVGCDSPEDVEGAALDCGLTFDQVKNDDLAIESQFTKNAEIRQAAVNGLGALLRGEISTAEFNKLSKSVNVETKKTRDLLKKIEKSA